MKIFVDPDVVPMTLEECITNIKKLLDNDDIEEIKAFDTNPFLKEKKGAADFIKFSWSLEDEENRLVKWFNKKHGIEDADNISELILHCLYCDVKEIPRKEVEVIEKCHKQKKRKKVVETEKPELN